MGRMVRPRIARKTKPLAGGSGESLHDCPSVSTKIAQVCSNHRMAWIQFAHPDQPARTRLLSRARQQAVCWNWTGYFVTRSKAA